MEQPGKQSHRSKIMLVQLNSLLDNLPEATQYFLIRAINRMQKEFIEANWAGKLIFVMQAVVWCVRKSLAVVRARISRGISSLFMARGGFVARNRANNERVKVAINCTGGLGDLLVYGGFIRSLYRDWQYPRIHVFYPSLDTARFVFNMARFVERVLHGASFESVKDNYDVVVHLNQFVTYKVINADKLLRVNPELLNKISEASQRAEEFRPYVAMHPYLDGVFAQQALEKKQTRRLDVLGYLGQVQFGQDDQLYLCPDIRANRQFVDELGLKDKPYITVHDGWDNHFHLNHQIKDAATKCWPQANWEECIKRFKAECPDVFVVQLGGNNSRVLAGTDLCFVGKTSLNLAAWIIKHALLHVDSDSGLAHLARAVHTKSLVLFGPTSIDYFRYAANMNVSSTECSNCWWATSDWMVRCPIGFKEPICMQSIPAEQIADMVVQYVRSTGKKRYEVADERLYDSGLIKEDEQVLENIFDRCGITTVPISQHAKHQESGIYIHASKQWEYLFILRALNKLGAGRSSRMKIADLGGGRGALSAYLAKLGHEVTVYDVDYLWDHGGDELIEQRYMGWARANGYQAELGSLFNVPADNGTCDAVVSVSVLEHVPYKYFALKEAFRLLKPGGIFVMTFDFAVTGMDVSDSKCRIEVFNRELLQQTLEELGIAFKMFTLDQVKESAARIQDDRVLGIPEGMTVGGLVIRKCA